jgi:hypothetical protein
LFKIEKQQLVYFAPIILFIPQLFFSFQAILSTSAVWMDWLLLFVAIAALFLSGFFVLSTKANAPKLLGKLYIVTSVGSLLFLIITTFM